MQAPTNQELQLLFKFRSQVSDLGLTGFRTSDTYLLRWIRARDHKLKDAETMLRKHTEWRKVNDIDEIHVWEAPETILNGFPLEIVGYNNAECPVLIIPFGRWDVRKTVGAGERDSLVRYIDKAFETTEALMRKRSTEAKPSTQLVLIFEVQHLNFMQLASVSAVETILEVVRRFEANHPETLFSAYVVNASRVFAMLFKLVKPFLSPRTLGKVQIHQTNVEKWRGDLLKEIPQDQLPKYFGGTGSTFMKYYNQETQTDCETDEEELVKVDIGAGGVFHLHFDIDRPQTALSWKFRTDHYDIGFRVIRLGDETEVEVVEYDRVQSHMSSIQGQIICQEAGKYKVEFDNLYSRMRGKTLYYIVNISTS